MNVNHLQQFTYLYNAPFYYNKPLSVLSHAVPFVQIVQGGPQSLNAQL